MSIAAREYGGPLAFVDDAHFRMEYKNGKFHIYKVTNVPTVVKECTCDEMTTPKSCDSVTSPIWVYLYMSLAAFFKSPHSLIMIHAKFLLFTVLAKQLVSV